MGKSQFFNNKCSWNVKKCAKCCWTSNTLQKKKPRVLAFWNMSLKHPRPHEKAELLERLWGSKGVKTARLIGCSLKQYTYIIYYCLILLLKDIHCGIMVACDIVTSPWWPCFKNTSSYLALGGIHDIKSFSTYVDNLSAWNNEVIEI